MTLVIPNFFDFACPWSYAASHREAALERELAVRFAHMPWELSPGTPAEGEANPYAEPSEELLAFARGVGVKVPTRKVRHNTSRALAGVLVARAHGREREYVDAAFRAYWSREANLADDAVLASIAEEAGIPAGTFFASVNARVWRPSLEAVDALAEALGVEATVTYALPDGDGSRRLVSGLGAAEDVRSALKAALD